jgi:hypothetical protein
MVIGVLHLAVDEIDYQLNQILERAGNTSGGATGGKAEDEKENDAQDQGNRQGVDVQAEKALAKLQEMKMVQDVFTGRHG